MVFNKEISMQLMAAHIRKISPSGKPFDEPNFLDEQIKKAIQKEIQVKWVAYWIYKGVMSQLYDNKWPRNGIQWNGRFRMSISKVGIYI